MNEQNKFFLFFIALALVCFCIVKFLIIPQEQPTAITGGQDDALTHDITAVLEYKSPYLGDNSNTVNLFYHLPLNNIATRFEIDGDNRALTVNYLDTVENIGEDKVKRDLIYNATAAMALIDNLDEITFYFSGDTYIFNRDTLKSAFDTDLSALLGQEIWNECVRDKLNDPAFVNSFYEM